MQAEQQVLAEGGFKTFATLTGEINLLMDIFSGLKIVINENKYLSLHPANLKTEVMKKVLLITMMMMVIASCSNVHRVGPFEKDKVICRENVDTVIAHMKGWRELSSYYDKRNFLTETDREGKRTEFYKWVLIVNVTDGKDTLMVSADDSKGLPEDQKWEGEVFGRIGFSDTAEAIKRQNLAIKRACGNDSCFQLSVNSNKVMSATFTKHKPKEPERPLEDYGLTEQDL